MMVRFVFCLEQYASQYIVEPTILLPPSHLNPTAILSLSHALELKDILERKDTYDSPASQVNAYLSLIVHYQGK